MGIADNCIFQREHCEIINILIALDCKIYLNVAALGVRCMLVYYQLISLTVTYSCCLVYITVC